MIKEDHFEEQQMEVIDVIRQKESMGYKLEAVIVNDSTSRWLMRVALSLVGAFGSTWGAMRIHCAEIVGVFDTPSLQAQRAAVSLRQVDASLVWLEGKFEEVRRNPQDFGTLHLGMATFRSANEVLGGAFLHSMWCTTFPSLTPKFFESMIECKAGFQSLNLTFFKHSLLALRRLMVEDLQLTSTDAQAQLAAQ